MRLSLGTLVLGSLVVLGTMAGGRAVDRQTDLTPAGSFLAGIGVHQPLGKREWYKFWEWGIWTWTWPRQKYTLYICPGIKFDEPSKTVCVSPKHQTRCGEWIGAFTVERQPVFLEWQIVGVCPELKRDMIFESPSKPPKYQTRTRKWKFLAPSAVEKRALREGLEA